MTDHQQTDPHLTADIIHCGSCVFYNHTTGICKGSIGSPAHREHPESMRCLWWISWQSINEPELEATQ